MAEELFDLDASLGSEEEDEDFDGENGEPRKRTNGINGLEDSSEEEDEDDEEKLRKVRHCCARMRCSCADSPAGRRRFYRRRG